MNKLTLISLLVFYSALLYAQQDILFFKKGKKTVDRFWQGSVIAFQLKDHQWQKGEITKLQHDSIYIRPMVVRYNPIGTDTFHFNVEGFALTDIFAMPKKGLLIDYVNGQFQISRAGGHVHWYWVKSGWLFRVGAVGYAALDLANGLIKDSYSFKGSKLGIAAGVFLFGVLLKHTYKPTLRLRKKYHLETLQLARAPSVKNL